MLGTLAVLSCNLPTLQTANDRERFPKPEYVSHALIGGRWERAKELLNEVGSFKKPQYKRMGENIIVYLCGFAGASDRYANALTSIRLAHEYGASVTSPKNDAMAAAASMDQWGQITERLLQYGYKPDDRCTWNNSLPLYMSIQYNAKTKALEALLKYKADPNIWSNDVHVDKDASVSGGPEVDRMTCLMVATIKGKTEHARILLQYKAKANLASKRDKMTALHYAAKYNRSDIIPILLKAGASKNMRNRRGLTPLQVARKARATKAIKLLD
jgi:hypothetical protein